VKTMICAKNHKQGDLFDPWAHLGPKRRNLLDKSWAGLFRERILEALPVEELMPFSKEGFGRPTKELRLALRPVYVFKELFLLIRRDSRKILFPAAINSQPASQTAE